MHWNDTEKNREKIFPKTINIVKGRNIVKIIEARVFQVFS